MSIRRIKCNECLTGMYDFDIKQAFSCRYRQENSNICIKLLSFLPIIYGRPLQGFARLFQDKVLSNKTPCKCKSIDCLCFCAYRAHCLLSRLVSLQSILLPSLRGRGRGWGFLFGKRSSFCSCNNVLTALFAC